MQDEVITKIYHENHQTQSTTYKIDGTAAEFEVLHFQTATS